MSRNFTRMLTALTGPALAAGILAAGLVGSAPAQAQVSSSQTQTCVTSTGAGAAKSGAPNGLTRAGQLSASAPSAASAPKSCVGGR
jgi:hypothetical protein